MNPDSSDEMVDHMVDFFDRIAPVYDTWAGGQHGRVASRLVDLAAPAKNEQVLDVGTGTGLVAHLVGPRVNPGLVIGIDLSSNMLSIARSRMAKNIQFVGMAAENLVFRPATFDLVTMGETLAYLADPTEALAEANRVLRTGGRLAVSCQRRSLSTRAQELFFQGLVPLARRHYLSLPRYTSERSRFGEPDQLPQVLYSVAQVGVGDRRSAENLMKAVQAKRGQCGKPDQHPHRAREHDQARGQAVALAAGEGEHGRGQRRDNEAEAESADRER